jgi:hypothetical protein
MVVWMKAGRRPGREARKVGEVGKIVIGWVDVPSSEASNDRHE